MANKTTHQKDMTTTRREFFRNLAVALKNLPHEINTNQIIIGNGDKRIELQLSPLSPRVLSQTVQLERWQLDMTFFDYAPEEKAAFLAIFDRAFQRGGG